MRFLSIFVFAVLTAIAGSITSVSGPVGDPSLRAAPSIARFRIDAANSKFIVHADRAGLAWFKGHSHRIAVGDFSGEASLALDAVTPASLEMSVRADSLEETSPDFTDKQKGIINRELKEIVLESEKFPEIHFKSTKVAGRLENGAMAVKITGALTLHGITKQIEIPAKVTLDSGNLRAVGTFEINRKNFKVNATEAFHGFVKIRHSLKFEFDIVAVRE